MIDGDTPIELVNVSEMSDNDLDALIQNIRERRLKPIAAYEAAKLMKDQAKEQGLLSKLEKQGEMFQKELVRVDKALESLEKRALNIRAIRLELGDLTAMTEMQEDES